MDLDGDDDGSRRREKKDLDGERDDGSWREMTDPTKRKIMDLGEREDGFNGERDYGSRRREKKDHDGREEGDDGLKIK
ncbi:hypothetical protein Bca4012_057400 [Brassica carinata]